MADPCQSWETVTLSPGSFKAALECEQLRSSRLLPCLLLTIWIARIPLLWWLGSSWFPPCWAVGPHVGTSQPSKASARLSLLTLTLITHYSEITRCFSRKMSSDKAGSEKACRKEEAFCVRSGAWVEMWASLSSEQGKRSVQDRQTHFPLLLQSRALVMKAVTGSSCGNPHTGAASTAVWKGWIISPGCFAWRDLQWNDIFSQQSPGWLQQTLCACKQALLLLLAVFDCLLIAVASGMNEQTHPDSSWDLLFIHTHASVMKVCGKGQAPMNGIDSRWMQDMQFFILALQPLCLCLQ